MPTDLNASPQGQWRIGAEPMHAGVDAERLRLAAVPSLSLTARVLGSLTARVLRDGAGCKRASLAEF